MNERTIIITINTQDESVVSKVEAIIGRAPVEVVYQTEDEYGAPILPMVILEAIGVKWPEFEDVLPAIVALRYPTMVIEESGWSEFRRIQFFKKGRELKVPFCKSRSRRSFVTIPIWGEENIPMVQLMAIAWPGATCFQSDNGGWHSYEPQWYFVSKHPFPGIDFEGRYPNWGRCNRGPKGSWRVNPFKVSAKAEAEKAACLWRAVREEHFC